MEQYAKGDYRAAIDHLSAALRHDASWATAYAWRAAALEQLEAHDKAIADLNKAIELDPTELSHRSGRASIYYEKNDYDRALADVNVIISTSPLKRFEAYRLRGCIFQDMGDSRRAADDFEEVLRLVPEDLMSLQWLASVYAASADDRVRNGPRAIELATRACELEGWKSAVSLSALAAAHAESGDFDAARRWKERATQLSSGVDKLESLFCQLEYALRRPSRYGSKIEADPLRPNRIEAGIGYCTFLGSYIRFEASFTKGFCIARLPIGMFVIVVVPIKPIPVESKPTTHFHLKAD